MKKIIAILILSISFQILAGKGEDNTMVYQIGKQRFFLSEIEKNVWVSQSCMKQNCLAKSSAANKYEVPKNIKFGKNPASIICKTQMGGEVVFGYHLKTGQQSFCRFKDKSLLLMNNFAYKN